jgi:hypothetical protein
LKEIDYQKLQNDENALQDFIRDKYERRRYAKKGKDPMALIFEGKDIEEIKEKKESSDKY